MKAFLMATLLLLTTAGTASAQFLASLDEDKKLGSQVEAEILANPKEYPILDEKQYAEAYQYLWSIVNRMLQSGKVKYAKDFQWSIKIINKDVKNAFCAPGGKIYVYTGLIRMLEFESELAGILGHEIAHADLRHTARAMRNSQFMQLGIGLLGSRTGQMGQVVANVAGNLANLRFSRDHEREADAASVEYLCGTPYDAGSCASFFERLKAQGGAGQGWAILSTHPDPGNRINDIRNLAKQKGCKGQAYGKEAYTRFKNLLPFQYAG